MARSRWKFKYFSFSIWRKVKKLYIKKKFRKRITFERSSSIPSCFVNKIVRIHKGKRGRTLLINFLMVGKKFGEFSFSRKPYHYPSKRLKKKQIFIRR